MKRIASPLVACLLLVGLVPGSALASTFTVDQSQTDISQSVGIASPILAQTFTAGLAGQMESVDLYLYGGPSTVTVSLQGVTGSPPVPDGNILGQKVLGVNGGPSWVRFGFSTNPVVIPGHVYSIFIYLTGSLNAVYGSSTSTYSHGRALWFTGGSWQTLVIADFAFKTNVDAVAPTPTPTPTRAPTPRPTTAPVATHAPTPIATGTPTSTPAPIATAAASEIAVAGVTPDVASSSSGSTAGGGTDGSGTALNSPGATPGGSGDSSGSLLPLFGGIAALLAVGLVVLLLFSRRRKPAEAPDAS
jgi:hypothetical protein